MPAVKGGTLEINAAYALIKQALEPHGSYKTGPKCNEIVLTFISPQVGQRRQALITQLSEHTGYPLSIHPYPNQQDILQIANELFKADTWVVHKGPGIHTDRAEVSVTLIQLPDSTSYEAVWHELDARTGYKLVG